MSHADKTTFKFLGKEVEPDDRKRLALATALPGSTSGIRYRVFTNDLGQILLDPVKSVPAYEAWIYENPDRISSIQKGIKQIEEGQTVSIKLPKTSED